MGHHYKDILNLRDMSYSIQPGPFFAPFHFARRILWAET